MLAPTLAPTLPATTCGTVQPPTQLPPLPSTILQIVQHVTGFNHYLVPPLFGFSLSMSVLMCECREDGCWSPLLPRAEAAAASRVGRVICGSQACCR